MTRAHKVVMAFGALGVVLAALRVDRELIAGDAITRAALAAKDEADARKRFAAAQRAYAAARTAAESSVRAAELAAAERELREAEQRLIALKKAAGL